MEQELVTVASNPLDIPAADFAAALERRGSNRKALMAWVREALKAGTDYGTIQIGGRASKESLWKPGAEKICGMLGLRAIFPTLPDYEKAAIAGQEINHIILRCHLLDAQGNVVADGVGARSVEKERGDLNKALKMAEKCLGGRTPVLVKSKHGIVRTDLHRAFSMWGANEGNLHIAGPNASWRKILRFEQQYSAPVKRLTFRNGTKIIASLGHRWPIGNSLVETRELKVGNILNVTSLPSGYMIGNSEIGFLVGFYLAEGTLSKNSVRLHAHAIKDEASIHRIEMLCEDFGIKTHRAISGKKLTLSLKGHMPIGIIKHFIGGSDSYTKRLRRNTWMQSKDFLSEVMSGYLAGDGSLAEREGRQAFWEVGFTGRNRELRNDLMCLSAQLGYKAFIKMGETTCQTGTFPTWRGRISNVAPLYNGKSPAEILSIEDSFAPTYELEVDGDNLFCIADGIVTHNSALIDATLRCAGLSEIFTQDIEDMNLSEPQKPTAEWSGPNQRKHYSTEIQRMWGSKDSPGLRQLWNELDTEQRVDIWSDFNSVQRREIKLMLEEAK